MFDWHLWACRLVDICLDMVVPARLLFYLFTLYWVWQLNGHSVSVSARLFLFTFQICEVGLNRSLKLALIMSAPGGLLVPVHGVVYRQAQPQVTHLSHHLCNWMSQRQFLHPLSVAAPQGCAAQGMPVESSLPSQLLETLVAKVADKVFSSFCNGSSCSAHHSWILSVNRGGCLLIFKHLAVHLCLTFYQWISSHPFLRFSWGHSFIRNSAKCGQCSKLTDRRALAQLNWTEPLYRCFGFTRFWCNFWVSLVPWEVATRLGTKEYRFLGILSHCFEFASVGRGYV